MRNVVLLIFMFVLLNANEIKDMESKCGTNDFAACATLGTMYEERLDNKNAAIAYEKACEGASLACNNLANLYINGLGVKQDVKKAIVIYHKACEDGSMESCRNLGHLLGAVNEYDEAARLLFKACDGGDYLSCSNLGVLYAQGSGVKQNYHKAKEYFEKACNNDVGVGCANLGVAHFKALGTTKQCESARNYFEKSCALGSQDGCIYHKCLFVISSATCSVTSRDECSITEYDEYNTPVTREMNYNFITQSDISLESK